MSANIHGQYLEAEVLGADPVKLAAMLYRGALEAVQAARRHLRSGDIRERSRRISQAYEILHELLRALNHEAGGEISRNLAELYLYMQNRVLEANARQTDPPLAEVESLLQTLMEAWKGVPAIAPAHDPEATVYAPISCSY
jgi:flagellar secretion chaperone FliS